MALPRRTGRRMVHPRLVGLSKHLPAACCLPLRAARRRPRAGAPSCSLLPPAATSPEIGVRLDLHRSVAASAATERCKSSLTPISEPPAPPPSDQHVHPAPSS